MVCIAQNDIIMTKLGLPLRDKLELCLIFNYFDKFRCKNDEFDETRCGSAFVRAKKSKLGSKSLLSDTAPMLTNYDYHNFQNG